MKNRIFSAFLAVVTVLTLFGFNAICVSAADNTFTALNDGCEYAELGTSPVTVWSGEIDLQTEDLRKITFWVHVKDVTAPIYLIGTRFSFTTTDGSDFGTNGTGSQNIQNNGFYVDKDGDYLITVTLGESRLAWNWKEENGYFDKITLFGTAAVDAASYDANKSTVGTTASAALMGVFEGELDLSAEATYTSAEVNLGTGAATYTDAAVIGVDFNSNPNCYADKTIGFKKVVAPFTAGEVAGKEFVDWLDKDGNHSISLITDSLTARYKNAPSSYVLELVQFKSGVSTPVTVKVADKAIGITSGTVELSYDPELLTTEGDPDKTGKVSFDFDSVAEDGTVGTVYFSGVENSSFSTIIKVEGSAANAEGEIRILPAEGKVTQVAYLDSEAVVIGKNDGVTSTVDQSLWTGDVQLNGADGITFVYKLDGVNTPINIANFAIAYTGTKTDGTQEVNANSVADTWWKLGKLYDYTFTKDGYFFMYINIAASQMTQYDSVQKFMIYTGEGQSSFAKRNNTNDNATFEMLAISAGNLQPTVTYHDEAGNVIATVTHKYTDVTGLTNRMKSRLDGELLSPAKILENASKTAPTKDGEHPKIFYTFDCWVDADGNPVDAVYGDCDVYPTYKKNDLRSLYTVEFKNWDGTVLQSEVIPEGELPEYKGETPARATDDKNSYDFAGWDKEIVACPDTDLTDGALVAQAIVYTATYDAVTRNFSVTYMDEAGENVLSVEDRVYEGTAADEAPEATKDSDIQYNYTFDCWVDAEGNPVDLTNVTKDLTVYASFKATIREYKVTFVDYDGTIIKEENVKYGEDATAPEATREDDKWYTYSFNNWYVGDEIASFEAISGDITVTAVYDPTFKNPYGDLDLTQYYGAAVEYMLANGIMNGTGATTFTPNGTADRAMFVTVLYRMEGSPDVSEIELPFSDVKAGSWYTDAIKWAYSEGIVNGVTATKFAPTNAITREQFVTILYRYAKYKEIDVTLAEENTLFTFYDAYTVSAYALDAVKWATAPENAFVGGMSEGGKTVIKPANTTTRAQMATMLYRFLQKNG